MSLKKIIIAGFITGSLHTAAPAGRVNAQSLSAAPKNQSLGFNPVTFTAGTIASFIMLYEAAIPILYLSFQLASRIPQIAPINLMLNLYINCLHLLTNPIFLFFLFGLMILEDRSPTFFKKSEDYAELACTNIKHFLKFLDLDSYLSSLRDGLKKEVQNSDLKQVLQSVVVISVAIQLVQPLTSFLIQWILHKIFSCLIVALILLLAAIYFAGPDALLSISEQVLSNFKSLGSKVFEKISYQSIKCKINTLDIPWLAWFALPLVVMTAFLALLSFCMPLVLLVFSGFLIKTLTTRVFNITDPFAQRIIQLYCLPYNFLVSPI